MSVTKKTYSIRKMKDEDILAVSSLELGCFSSHPWPEKEILYELHGNPVAFLYVATNGDEVVGYIDFMITFDSATINRIAVNENERKKGIGQALLDKMVEICHKQKEPVEFITLEVRPSNAAACQLYLKNGWKEVTVKKGYYDDGEDAIYMIRSILQ
jgi:[ribosomal protein S18]-alanine N-acetyltransferase